MNVIDQAEDFKALLPNLEAIFFDLDGTLCDSMPVLYASYSKFLEDFQVNASKEEFETLIGPSIEEIVQVLIEKHELPLSYEHAKGAYKKHLYEAYAKDIRLFSHTIELLTQLEERGIQLALVTSAPKEFADNILKAFSIEPLFSVVVTATDVKHTKPHPEPYLLALEKTGVSKEKALCERSS